MKPVRAILSEKFKVNEQWVLSDVWLKVSSSRKYRKIYLGTVKVILMHYSKEIHDFQHLHYVTEVEKARQY